MSKHPSLPPNSAVQQLALLIDSQEFEQGLQLARTAIEQGLRDANLYYLAGVCAVHSRLPRQAEEFWRLALGNHPSHAEAQANLATLLHELKRPAEAEVCYRSALRLDPGNAYLHARFAGLLASRRHAGESEHHYRQALDLDPSDARSHANLGVLLASVHKNEEAEQHYRQALALEPGNASTHINLGLLLAGKNALPAAQQCYSRALELEPGNAAAFSNLGLLLEQDGNDTLAAQCHRKAAGLTPDSRKILCNLGNFLAKLHQHEEAEQLYRRATALPADVENAVEAAAACTSLGVLLTDTGRVEEAESYFREAMQLDPAYPLAASNLALLLLQQGRYTEAWPYYEARHDPLMAKPMARPPASCGSLWQGEDLTGKTMLVWPEQGLGDLIHFSRYIPMLKQRGATHVTVACRASLQPLLSTLDGVDRCLILEEGTPSVAFNYCVLAMSLPGLLQMHSAALPAALPYLHSLPERRSYWTQRLAANAGTPKWRIGLAWDGNARHSNDAERSLGSADKFAPLWGIDGVQWISLQQSAAAVPTPAGLDTQAWLALGHELRDFADTAAIVEMLDLVISVDTSVAHLTGALGKACWILLPAYKTDWRWLESSSSSSSSDSTPWYPDVMRLFRQPRRGDWDSPLNAVASELKKRLQAG
ncbi:tetratricopeptide repeat protein [Undibacterium sp. TJN25]|uniref:tetratricopeptide repeat protein n=1 Tax=Undibacterium sp. TJN25 TaxID=3413056 RepID=UPI003BF33413